MDHPLASPKWTLPETATAAALTRSAVIARAAENLARSRARSWTELTGDRWRELFDERDGAELAATIFARFREEEGRLYVAGCVAAVREDPERYVLRSDLEATPGPLDLPAGVLGDGDNVFAAPDVTGTVFLMRDVAEVHRLMTEGVPDGTIGVIDDAGGTMTAPILPDLEAAICLAGTVRSHLAIIAREFGVPTLMGARLARPLRTGERITIAFSTPARSVEAYFGDDVQPRAQIRLADDP
jgi:phosphohistidine swiveling domain-containing protein